ncbi:hypothetical protein AK830_g2739 [Neonectria ditissima]|uniref:Xylanolytic transcriptional activator regulatory domain-containing protein n=1 Tax=Neonectria ditissima TaxID=78410 RepID=A0A0P7BAD4_9HYPO|nr:hypothetical protein AK830_g2739 [Neonectria ditissima]
MPCLQSVTGASTTIFLAPTIGFPSRKPSPYLMSRPLAITNHSPPLTFAKIYFGGFLLGRINSSSGIPSFSPDGLRWIQSRTGETPSLFTFDTEGLQRPSHVPLIPSLSAGYGELSSWLELPDRKIVLEHLRVFSSSFWSQFPLVDPILFQQTINLAYESQPFPPSNEHISAKACVFIFLTIMAFMQEEAIDFIPQVDGDACAAKAQYLLPQVLLEVNTVTLQTVFMLAMYQAFAGQIPAAVVSHSIACRIAIMLGAHSEPTLRNQPGDDSDYARRTKIHLRDLFWLCYTFDKELALRTDHPPCIADEHCDLTLLDGYLEAQYADDEDGASPFRDPKTAIPSFPVDLRLSLIKSKTSRLLYSAEGRRKNDAKLLSDIRELDDELEQWRVSVPLKFRPTLSRCREPQLDHDRTPLKSTRIIMTHVDYHYIMVVIHLACGRCSAWPEVNRGGTEGVSSSLALCVEASRSTLIYLRAATHLLFGGAFCLILFHPIAAITTIFCNILLNPLDPAAKDDLELLKTGPELIRRMRVHQLPHEILHIKQVDNFVAELVRLGSCAIRNAQYERDSIMSG